MSATLGAQIIPFTPRPQATARTPFGNASTGDPTVPPSGPENGVAPESASDPAPASGFGAAAAPALGSSPARASGSAATPGPASASATTAAQRAAQERLARALARLNEALADQSAAIAGWRGAMCNLSNSMHALRRSAQDYQSNLSTLDRKVAGLRAEAERLGRWADAALANGKPPGADRKQ